MGTTLYATTGIEPDPWLQDLWGLLLSAEVVGPEGTGGKAGVALQEGSLEPKVYCGVPAQTPFPLQPLAV